MVKRFVTVLAVVLLAAGLPGHAQQMRDTRLPLKELADITLPGNPTRLDYQSYDSQRHLLFIAHLGDSDVVVVDTKARRVVATIPNVNQVHGVLVVPAQHMVYAS